LLPRFPTAMLRRSTSRATARCCRRTMRARRARSAVWSAPIRTIRWRATRNIGSARPITCVANTRTRPTRSSRVTRNTNRARKRRTRCSGSAWRSPSLARRMRPAPRSTSCERNIRRRRSISVKMPAPSASISAAEMQALPITLLEARALLAPLRRFPRVALAVSGGPDSLALMQLAARLRAELGVSLTVLTVDHGLRESSGEEAARVGRQAAALGLPHAILTWAGGESRAASLQARARAARYDLMAAYCHAHDIQALVTAHHLDDQAETFLMRLKRGSGLDGLAAIPERGAWAGIAVLRPLLEVEKARLVATLREADVSFVCDPSNQDPRFERARVRGSWDALSLLGLTPEALAFSARRWRRAREALEDAARGFLAEHSETSEAGYALIDTPALAAAPQEIALRALARLIGAVGGGETPLQLAKLESLLAALAAHPARAHTLGPCRIEPISGRLGVFREGRGSGLARTK